MPHLLMAVACLVAIVITVQQSIALRTLYNPIVLYWLIIGFKNLVFAVFFMFGRSNVRFSERFYAQEPVTIRRGKDAFEGVTSDISETGLAVVLGKPAYLPPDELVRLSVCSSQYTAEMDCRLMSVTQQGSAWKYGFKIETIDDKNKRIYMQVVYDRMHTLPMLLSTNASVFNDINTNLMQRTRRRQANKRKLPRMDMQLPFQTSTGQRGVLHDFNFEYAGLSMSFEIKSNETLTLNYGQDMVLVLQPSSDVQSNTSTLFKVINMDELLERPDFERILEGWLVLQALPERSKPVGQALVHRQVEAPHSPDR